MRRSTWRVRRVLSGLGLAVGVAGLARPAGAVDFFWSATEDVFGWFDRETPSGPPGFSPWQLLGGGISGQAPDDVSDTATFGLIAKTTTYNSGITIDRATINGGELQINGGTLTTINGISLNGADAELSFTGGTINNSDAALTVNAGTVRQISGFGTISSDVVTSGDFIVGGAGTMTFNRNNGSFTQNAGSFTVNSGSTVNFSGNSNSLSFDGGTLVNDGTASVGSGAFVDLDGVALTNRGLFNVNSNSTVNLRSGTLDNSDPTASFNVNSGGTFSYFGGSITGNAIQIGNAGTLNLNVPVGASGSGLGSPSFQFNGNGTLTGDIHSAITVSVGDNSGSDNIGTAGSWENRGNLILTGSTVGNTALFFQSGSTLTNSGTFRAAFAAGGSQDRRINSNSGGTFANTAAGELIVEAGVQLTADMDLVNTGDVTVGTGGSMFFGSGDRFEMNGGTLANNGRVLFNAGSGPSEFHYAGGAITGNEIEFNFGILTLAGGNSPATFRFSGGNNDHNGDILAGQTVIVDAATGDTTARRGNNFQGDFSFSNAGTILLTGADPNDTATFNLFGGDSVLTHSGLIHAQGVPGSSNIRTFGGTGGATINSSGQINIDPDTRLNININVVNTGSVNIGNGATLDTDAANANLGFTHNAGSIVNNGTFITDNFTYNGGTITGNAIDVNESILTLGAGSGSASFILRRGVLAGDVNAGQTVELRNDTANTALSETPGVLDNNGTIIFGGDGTGNHFFRIGPLFQNLTLTNHNVFRTRNDDQFGAGGFRQLNGVLDNRGTAVVEANSAFQAVGVVNHGNFTVDPGGTLGTASGGTFAQESGTLVNNGTVDFLGGRFEYNGGNITGNPITLDTGTLILGPNSGGGTFVMVDGGAFGGTVGENAEVHFVAPSTGSRVINLTTAPGNIFVDGLIVLDESAGGTIQLRTANSHVVETEGELRGSGTLSYQIFPGTLLNRGLIAPGLFPSDPTGTINVAGLFTQEAGGTLELDLGGTATTEFDRVTASGAVTLAGTLDLSPANGYTPALGDELTVITGSSVTGTFDEITGFIQATRSWEVLYTSNSVKLRAVLSGDYNNDGSVDQGDLDLVLLNWGDDVTVSGVPAGWINLQPVSLIGQLQLDGVLLNWGNTAEAVGNAVPEPATLGLAVASLLVISRRRRR